ncbi:MAG: hypothetical protein IT385_02680, partial [Deltaproteobacteria bacterium]|nr:hypothetical protein [Deltaproteobacteria bacterium]
MTTFTVVDDLAPLVDGTDWAEVELTEGRGRGIAVWFALAPSPTGADPIAALERLTARPDPLLAPVAEYGVDDGEGYVVWSGTLDETLAALSGPLTMAEIVSLADVVLAGFERLHAAGFVHPRLGPDVVRLVPDDEGRVVPEVLGFGLPWGDRTT